MNQPSISLWTRFLLFFWAPWKILFSSSAAARVHQALLIRGPLPQAPAAPAPAPAKANGLDASAGPAQPDPGPALHLLAILQRDGRLIDFLQEEIAAATDAQVGAAARVVHEGCRKALGQYFTFEPIRPEEEGMPVIVPVGFDPIQIRLTGKVVGAPPFSGHLAHPGWRATEVKLPALGEGNDPAVIAPAEVEV